MRREPLIRATATTSLLAGPRPSESTLGMTADTRATMRFILWVLGSSKIAKTEPDRHRAALADAARTAGQDQCLRSAIVAEALQCAEDARMYALAAQGVPQQGVVHRCERLRSVQQQRDRADASK